MPLIPPPPIAFPHLWLGNLIPIPSESTAHTGAKEDELVGADKAKLQAMIER